VDIGGYHHKKIASSMKFNPSSNDNNNDCISHGHNILYQTTKIDTTATVNCHHGTQTQKLQGIARNSRCRNLCGPICDEPAGWECRRCRFVATRINRRHPHCSNIKFYATRICRRKSNGRGENLGRMAASSVIYQQQIQQGRSPGLHVSLFLKQTRCLFLDLPWN